MGNGRDDTPVGGAASPSSPEAAQVEPANGSTSSSPSDRKERILEALGDRWSREILLLLNDSPRSAQEIQSANRIPQSTLYRKLHELSEIGLIGVQRSVISSDGKRVELYRSLLDELKVEMRGARLRVDVRFRDLAAERLKEMWRDVRKEAGRS
ncbi:MAG TPA: helix-turn-helix domain-containing protein [Thermoplasmata archaeon]|nr:helix-turn-helix domain-containing protein [Thermoplasmata archaeon]